MLMNAFPLQIVADGSTMIVTSASHEEARKALFDGGSAVDHATTARLLETILLVTVPCERVTVPTTTEGDVVVAQYSGPRLPEGATELPEGATITFRRVRWFPCKF